MTEKPKPVVIKLLFYIKLHCSRTATKLKVSHLIDVHASILILKKMYSLLCKLFSVLVVGCMAAVWVDK